MSDILLTPITICKGLLALRAAYERADDDFDIVFTSGEWGKGYFSTSININTLLFDAVETLKKQQEERERILTWLGKFCRHIDNGDKWLTDEENIAFFKEKMKQQFGWDTD